MKELKYKINGSILEYTLKRNLFLLSLNNKATKFAYHFAEQGVEDQVWESGNSKIFQMFQNTLY